jgi:hypothetical protein
MKKALFAAFAGVCVISSLMATSTNGKLKTSQHQVQFVRDTIPGKTDTTRYPKHDTTKMPRLVDESSN